MAARKPSICRVKLSEFVSDPKNPRQHPDKAKRALGKSVKRFGAARSVVVDGRNTVRAGNGTIEAALAAGIEEALVIETDGKELVVVRRPDWTDAEGQAYAISDNRTTDLSLFDDDQLRAAFGDLKFDESLMDATGFEPLEIADLLADPPSPLDAPEPQIDHASELQEKWRTAPGQLWTIGRHRLLVGDSTDEPQLERLLDGEIVGAVITDPPYSSGGQFRGDRAQATGTKYTTTGTLRNRPNFSGDNRDQRSWIAWCSAWLAKLLLHVEEGANLAVWSDWRQLPSLTDAIQGGGWVWRGVAGWDKTEAARPVLGRFRSQLEFVVWGSAGGLRDNKTDPPYPGTHRQAVKSAEKEHQTQKPLDVVVWSLSMARGIVVDPFLGAGTTMVACEKLGLRCFGAEISPPYAAVCLERLAGAGLTPILADKPARRKRAKQSSPVA